MRGGFSLPLPHDSGSTPLWHPSPPAPTGLLDAVDTVAEVLCEGLRDGPSIDGSRKSFLGKNLTPDGRSTGRLSFEYIIGRQNKFLVSLFENHKKLVHSTLFLERTIFLIFDVTNR